MAKIQQRFLTGTAVGIVVVANLAVAATLAAIRFYPDDPIRRVPPPLPVQNPKPRKLNDLYDYFYMTFGKPGEKHTPGHPIPAGAVNSLGEVPDSEWYTNRHAVRRMSLEELARGPGDSSPPSMKAPWRVTGAKTEGVTPGFTIQDAEGRTYQIKFDTPKNFEQPTGADVMGTRFFYALGYHTPENYIVYFRPEQLQVHSKARLVDSRGIERGMRHSDVEGVLARVPLDSQGRFRAVASYYLKGKPLGPFRFHGTRADDPNDVVPHEHRRDLRGLRVFSAWVNHNDSKSLNSLDMLVEENGVPFIRHHLIDFSAVFGAEAFQPKSPRAGYVPLFDWSSSAMAFFSFGLYIPGWARADHPHVHGIGRIEAEKFDPERWTGNYYNPAFANMLPDDAFWAAKQVMAFTEPEVRTMVQSAQYSDAEGVEYLIQVLMTRREKIGRAFFGKLLPLDAFQVRDGRLVFDDLEVKYGFRSPRQFEYRWAIFDNGSGTRTPLSEATTAELPSGLGDGYAVAQIRSGDPKKVVDVYVRTGNGRAEVAGVDRKW